MTIALAQRLTLRPTPRIALAGLLVLTWLAATAYGFWWFELRNLRSFAPQDTAVFFETGALKARLEAAAAGGEPPTLVHFYDPNCPCIRFNTEHVRELMAAYAPRGVRFLVMVPPGRGLEAKARTVFGVEAIAAPAGMSPPSSPAAALVQGGGELAYLGPYGVGAVCSAGAGGFVERVLDQLIAGERPRQMNTLAVGCFCPWPQRA